MNWLNKEKEKNKNLSLDDIQVGIEEASRRLLVERNARVNSVFQKLLQSIDERKYEIENNLLKFYFEADFQESDLDSLKQRFEGSRLRVDDQTEIGKYSFHTFYLSIGESASERKE